MFFITKQEGKYLVDHNKEVTGYGTFETDGEAQAVVDFLNNEVFTKTGGGYSAPRKDLATQEERNNKNKRTFRDFRMKGK